MIGGFDHESGLNDVCSSSLILRANKLACLSFEKRFSLDHVQRQKQCRIFNSRSGCLSALHLFCCEAKQPNLKMMAQPRQHMGSLPLDIALPT
jgi:hypothetical protein